MLSLDNAISQCVAAPYQAEMRAIVEVESGGNPNAIALIANGRMLMQPKSEAQARKTVELLNRLGVAYAAGAAQVNKVNFEKHGIEKSNMFDACKSVSVGAKILQGCHEGALKRFSDKGVAKQASWSCYYSGNFVEGFKKNGRDVSYVERVGHRMGIALSRGGQASPKEVKGGSGGGVVADGGSSNVFDMAQRN